MIRVRDIKLDTNEIFKLLKNLKNKQKDIEDQESMYYPKISLYIALRYKIFYENLLLHPKVITQKKFYQDKVQIIEAKELKDILRQVLEYEFTEKKEYLLKEERNKIIKVFNKLSQELEIKEPNI